MSDQPGNEPAPQQTAGQLRAQGMSLEEVAQQPGMTPAKMKMQGAWFTPEEQAAVDAYYREHDPEALAAAQQLDVEANQFDLSRIAAAKQAFLNAATTYYEARAARRTFKKGERVEHWYRRRTLDNLWFDAERAKADLEQQLAKARGPNRQRRLQRAIADTQARMDMIQGLIQTKIDEHTKLEEARQVLQEQVQARKSFLKSQHKALKKLIKPSLTPLLRERGQQLAALQDANLYWNHFPYQPEEDFQAQHDRIVGERRTAMGDPEEATFAAGVEQVRDPSEPGPTARGPLQHLRLIEHKIDTLTWPLQEIQVERDGLHDIERLVNASETVATLEDDMNGWFHRLLNLGRSVTSVQRFAQHVKKRGAQLRDDKVTLRKSGEYDATEYRNITGNRAFYLELGAKLTDHAVFSLGLSLVLSGSLRVDDDRRMRANLTLKFVPSFKAKLSNGADDVGELSAKLGFSISNRTYAFIDEKHFAYYTAFRIANKLNFADKLTKYGKSKLHQYVGLYDEDVRELLQKIVTARGGDPAEMEYYLKQPVVRAFIRLPGKLIPSADIGFSSAVFNNLGGGASGGLDLKYFDKTALVMPEGGAAPAPAPAAPASAAAPPAEAPQMDATGKAAPGQRARQGQRVTRGGEEFDRYEACRDGSCLYYCLGAVLGEDQATVRAAIADHIEAADRAAPFGSQVAMVHMLEQAEGDTDEARIAAHLAGVRGTAYGEELDVLAAADLYGRTLSVHTVDAADAAVSPLNWAQTSVGPYGAGAETVHLELEFRGAGHGGNHYNLLIPPGAAPQDDAQPATEDAGPTDAAATRRAQRQQDRDTNTPKLVCYTRRGGSLAGALNATGKLWFDLSAALTFSKIWDDPNPDNDGDYLNIKTTSKLWGVAFANFEDEEADLSKADAARKKAYEEEGGRVGTDPQDSIKDAVSSWLAKNKENGDSFFQDAFGDGLDAVSGAASSVKNWSANFGKFKYDNTRSTRTLEMNFVYNNGWFRKQYTRWVYASSLDVAADVPVSPGVEVALAAGRSKSVTLSERIGSNTLSYVITVFNGIKKRWHTQATSEPGTPESTVPEHASDQAKLEFGTAREQWDAFYARHRYGFTDLFRRIAKGDTNAAQEAQDLSALVDEHPGLWADDPDDPNGWVHADDAGQPSCSFVQNCNADAAETIRRQWSVRDPRHGFRKLNNEDAASAKTDELFARLTSLFYRASQVAQALNDNGCPWREKVSYLLPASGLVGLTYDLSSLQTNPGQYGYLNQRPKLKTQGNRRHRLKRWMGLRKRDEDLELYEGMEDVYLDPILADAESAREFYLHGFEVQLKLLLRHGTFKVSARYPDGEHAFRLELLKLVRKIVTNLRDKNRRKNLAALTNVCELDPDLASLMQQWRNAYEADRSAMGKDEWVKDAARKIDTWLQSAPGTHAAPVVDASAESVTDPDAAPLADEEPLGEADSGVDEELEDEEAAEEEVEEEARDGIIPDYQKFSRMLDRLRGPFVAWKD